MAFNIRSVDLNLLPVFEAVYEEGSLSRAAARLAMTQSAISHAVARLRSLFRDELFVRGSRGVVATPRADQIYAKLRGALESIGETVIGSRGFDPSTSERRFTLSIPHPLGPIIELRLQERFEKLAPRIEVVSSTRSRPIDLDRALREGRIDAAIDWLSPRGGQFKAALLFEDAMIAMARKDHPAFKSPASMKRLRECRFVSLRQRADRENAPGAILAVRRLEFDIFLEVSEILEIFMVASQSDLVGLLPRSMQNIGRSAFGLRVLSAMPKGPTLPIHLYWHESRDDDRAHAFLRDELAAVVAKVVRPR
jgi:DNA-binding transcriptional LysR family regulator